MVAFLIIQSTGLRKLIWQRNFRQYYIIDYVTANWIGIRHLFNHSHIYFFRHQGSNRFLAQILSLASIAQWQNWQTACGSMWVWLPVVSYDFSFDVLCVNGSCALFKQLYYKFLRYTESNLAYIFGHLCSVSAVHCRNSRPKWVSETLNDFVQNYAVGFIRI